MNKIISYSLWGNEPLYCVGALENIKGQKEFYPDWTCRFYVHYSVNTKLLHKLDKVGELIIINEEPYIDFLHRPMCWWRLRALKDKTIDRVIFRDIDSRLTLRERMIVKEWEDSGKEVHIIRDHEYHGCLMLTGMFGVTRKFIERIDYDDLVEKFENIRFVCRWSDDQEFLGKMIYPLAKQSMMVHDDKNRYGENALKINYPKINNHYIGEKIIV
jgi:hypothetical protein